MAIAQRQLSESENSASVASFNLAYSGAVIAGNCLIAVIRLGTQTITGITVSDNLNAGNWSLAKLVNDATNGRYVGIYYKENTAAGTPTVTVAWATANDGSFKGLDIYEYSGLATSGSLDQTNGTTTAQTTTPSSGNITTLNAADLLFGAFTFSTSATTTVNAESASFTQQHNNGIGSASHNHLHVADRIVSATGTYAYAPTLTPSPGQVCTIVIASFKAAGAVVVTSFLPLLGVG